MKKKMGSSKVLFFQILFALAILAVRFKAGGALPIVHFINAVGGENPAPIDLHIKASGLSSTAQLKPGQDYGMRVQVDDVYFVIGVCGSKFIEFHAYESARDKGRAAVFWKANSKGFFFSHDKVHWKLKAGWESE